MFIQVVSSASNSKGTHSVHRLVCAHYAAHGRRDDR